MLITIGAFDGFHRGHAELFDICRKNSDNWGVITFYPHPSEYIKRIKQTLFTLEEKEFIRRFLEIPNMYVLKFDDDLMRLKPENFWRLIRDKFNVDGLVMGSDFHFGFERSGSAECLKRLAEIDGVKNIVIADLLDKPEYSSSKVREYISSGEVDKANEILGYPFFIIGSVIHGNERGRTMNLPTANISVNSGRLIPSYGVYSCSVLINHKYYCGALSIGNNPTFGDIHETRTEVHILDFDGNIYGGKVMVMFFEKIRDIVTFSDKDSLIQQIKKDTEKCREIFSRSVNDKEIKKFMKSAEKIYYSQEKFEPEIINIKD